MIGPLCNSLPKRLAIVNFDYEIQLIKVELSQFKGKALDFEAQNYKNMLSRLKGSEKENYLRMDLQ